MKKYLLIVMAVVSFMFITSVEAKTKLPDKTDHEKVTVYLFRGHGCSHCRDFLTYFISKYEKYQDYFEIVAYESWEDEANQKLMLAVKKLVGESEDASVPFIVIGNDYKLMGFGANSGEEIIKAALKAYQDENYTDIVKKAIEDNNLTPTAETIAQAANDEGISVKEEYTTTDINNNYSNQKAEKKSDGVIVGIVFAVILLGFGGLVFISRK